MDMNAEYGFVEIGDALLRIGKIVAIAPHSYDSMQGRKNGFLVHVEGADDAFFISDMQKDILFGVLNEKMGIV